MSSNYTATRKRILLKAASDMSINNPNQLTEEKITKWLEVVASRTGKEETRNTYLIHFRQFTKWLTDKGKLYIDPCVNIESNQTEFTPRNSFLEAHEIRKIIDAAKLTRDKELELIILLGCECGMRHGEISAAKAEWVDLERNTITIPATETDKSWSRKGQVGRKKEVVIEMVSELRQWFIDNGIPSPYLLKPKQAWGKWKYRYDFKKKLKTHLKNCGHPDITIHDMRRSFGSNRVIAGRSIEQVANWMGIHPNTAWKYYARFTPVTGEIEHGSAASAAMPAPDEKETEEEKKESSPEENLLVIKDLLEKGLITEAEHKKLKKKILKKLQ